MRANIKPVCRRDEPVELFERHLQIEWFFATDDPVVFGIRFVHRAVWCNSFIALSQSATFPANFCGSPLSDGINIPRVRRFWNNWEPLSYQARASVQS